MIRKILQHFSHKRDRGILLAVLTALGSKIGGVSLQLFALPLVIRDLGTVDFALFAIASSILAFFMFSNVGIGGYLVVAIPEATHRPQKDVNVKSLISTSLFLTVSAGYLFTAVFFVFCAKFGLNKICGEIYEYAPIATFNIIIIVISFGFVQLLSSIFNAAQNAYQELHYSNIYGGVGSLTSTLCILSYFIFSKNSTVVGYVACFYFPVALCQLLNSLHFLKRHPEATPSLASTQISMIRPILLGGGAFAIAQTLFPLSIREFPKFLFASQGALQDVTTYSLLMTLLSMLGGITLSLTQPLFGGMSDAWAQDNTSWVKKRIVQVLMLFIALGVFLVVVGGLCGRSLIGIWVGENAAIPNSIMCLFGLFFSLSCIFHLFTLSLFAMRLKYTCVTANTLTALTFCLILISVDNVGVFDTIISASICLVAVGIPICLASFYLSNSMVETNGVARSL